MGRFNLEKKRRGRRRNNLLEKTTRTCIDFHMRRFNLVRQRRGRRRNNLTEKTTRTRFDGHIPVDIVLEILSRLPVKSILRFKSVCKTWYDVIQDPNFTEKHRAQSSLNPNLLLIDSGLGNEYNFRYSVVRRNRTYDRPFDNKYYLNLDEDLKMELYVVGILNGLVCMRNDAFDDDSVYIFNPATRQFRQYQEVGRPAFAVELFIAGAEFSSDSNYSLLSVDRRKRKNDSVTVCVEKCNIISGKWRRMNLKINNVLHDLVTYEFKDLEDPDKVTTVIVHGVIYWVLDCCGKWLVACLDICNAIYDEIRIPDAFARSLRTSPDLIELKGEIALILYGVPQDFWLEFWVLNESGREWTKKLTIKKYSIFNNIPSVLGCVKNSELLVQNLKSEFCLYDLNTRETKTLVVADYWIYVGAYIYTESLLSV